MTRLKNNWKDIFTFSKKERNGVIVFLAVVGAVVAFPLFYNRAERKSDVVLPDKNAFKQQLSRQEDFFDNNDNEIIAETVINTDRLFQFNPNTITKEQWIDFGLSEKTANTIINYTSKGGRFYKAADIRKIWGLKPEEADALIPYIHIEQNSQSRFSSFSGKGKNIPVIDINTATIEDWKALPGIGDVLSERIVKYRNSIKRFSAIEDIKKVYGISDATFNTITPYLRLTNRPKENITEHKEVASAKEEIAARPAGKVNINTASEREMIAAGLQRNVAKAIVVYRQQNGKFSSIQDVKKIIFINDEAYAKIAPLIETE